MRKLEIENAMIALVMALAAEIPSLLPLNLPQQRPLMVSFVQEDCAACKLQFREFACFEKLGWSIVIVGVGPASPKLKSLVNNFSLRRRESRIVSWQQAQSFDLSGTPTSFFIKGIQSVKKFQGVQTCLQEDREH